MKTQAAGHDLCVLLTAHEVGGHEVALFGWLADAVRELGLRPRILAPAPTLATACRQAGLGPWLDSAASSGRAGALRAVLAWPVGKPLLLAPGVLHVQAWLLAAALARGHRVWVYVPMTYSAVHMGYRWGRLRDRLLAPCVRRVEGWITLDRHQAGWLQGHWRVAAPVHALPNQARCAGPVPPWPPAPADGRLRVAYVGRFEPWQKGLAGLMHTLRRRPSWAAAVHWRFQGRGPAHGALQGLAQTLGAEQVAVCAHAPITQALAACDVLLLVSRFEGLPLVALEATACGWPVVASRECGLQELLGEQALFDFGDAAGLQRALERMRDPAQRHAAAAHARGRLDALCAPERYSATLRSLVQAWRPGPQDAPAPAPAAAC